jgi:hypothetical protein
MSTQSQFQISQSLSLYIPHVFSNITEEFIASVFAKNLGLVDHVDFVMKQNKYGKIYNAAYIHFAQWFNSANTMNFQEKLLNPELETRVLYDSPWYWVILENKTKKHISGEKKECLDLSDDLQDDLQDDLSDDLSVLSDKDSDVSSIISSNLEFYKSRLELAQKRYEHLKLDLINEKRYILAMKNRLCQIVEHDINIKESLIDIIECLKDEYP